MATKKMMKLSDMNVNAIQFAIPRTLSNGMKMVDVAFADGKPIIFQTSKLVAPWGVSTQYKQTEKFELTLLPTQDLMDGLYSIEAKVVQHMFANQEILGTAGKSSEQIQDKLSSSIKTDKYGMKIVPKLDQNTLIFNSDNNKVESPSIEWFADGEPTVTKQSKNYVLLHIPSIWVTNGRFGISFRVRQIQTFPHVESYITQFAFVPMEE
jgi:maltodextrin utilization protein YvdJ